MQASAYTAGSETYTFSNPCDYFTYGKAKASTLSLSVLVAIEMFNAMNALSEVRFSSSVVLWCLSCGVVYCAMLIWVARLWCILVRFSGSELCVVVLSVVQCWCGLKRLWCILTRLSESQFRSQGLSSTYCSSYWSQSI